MLLSCLGEQLYPEDVLHDENAVNGTWDVSCKEGNYVAHHTVYSMVLFTITMVLFIITCCSYYLFAGI